MSIRRELDHKIWNIAWPAILSNISVPTLGLVDAAILGHLGSTQYLGAVAIGSALLSFMYWGFSFLRMGTTGLVAKANGAGDAQGAFTVLAQSGVLALGLALAVIASHSLWIALGLTLMAPSGMVEPLAESYTSIRIYSAPAVLLTYAIVGWFIGRQNTRWPMVIMIVTNFSNIALDFLLIIGMGLNSDGAAYATVIAEYLGLALAVMAVWYAQPKQSVQHTFRRLMDTGAYGPLLRSNRHLFLRTICLLASFAFFTAMGNRLGGDVLAANAIMMQLLLFAAYGLDGIAFAAEGLAGNALGGQNLEGFYAAVRRCALWTSVMATGISLFMLLAYQPICTLLTNIPEVRQLMQQHGAWLIALPVLAAPSYLLDGIFIGSAETRPMMTTMLFSTFCVYLPIWYLSTDWGNSGLWLAFTAFNVARGASLYLCYRRLSANHGWLQKNG